MVLRVYSLLCDQGSFMAGLGDSEVLGIESKLVKYKASVQMCVIALRIHYLVSFCWGEIGRSYLMVLRGYS